MVIIPYSHGTEFCEKIPICESDFVVSLPMYLICENIKCKDLILKLFTKI